MKQKLLQLAKRESSKLTNKGFSLVEVLLASALFAIVVFGLTTTFLYGQDATIFSVNRMRAVKYAEAGLEAVRDIRNSSFSNMIDGTYGVTTSTGQWNLSGSSNIFDIYTRQVEISSITDDIKHVTSTVIWAHSSGRTGTVALGSRFSNWQAETVSTCSPQADYLNVDVSGVSLSASKKILQDIFISNTDPVCLIEIYSMIVSWTDTTSYMKLIHIDPGSVWTDTASSGVTVDIVDQMIMQADGSLETKITFSKNMTGDTFDISFVMSDATVKTVSGISP